MTVQELRADGLARTLKITIPQSDLTAKMDARLESLKSGARLDGFRPGKVPLDHLRQRFGREVMSEIVQAEVSAQSASALEARKERAATQPEVKIDGDVEKVLEGDADLIFDMQYEIVPAIKLMDFKKLKLEKPICALEEKQVSEAMEKLAAARKTFKPRDKGAKAEMGDSVTIDYRGTIDGEAFEGGAAESFALELGSQRFIPGFEEQLVGQSAGASCDVNVTFPKDYGNATFAGKAAVFAVTVHEVAAPSETELNDAFAKSLGMENLEGLRTAVQEQMQAEYEQMSRAHLKKALFDAVDAAHDFELPAGMVKLEFEQIWAEVMQGFQKEQPKPAEEKKLRAEHEAIAERRVRSGLVLAEVGEQNNITINDEEMQAGLVQHMAKFPGQEQQVAEYFRQNPQAVAQIRAPLFEDKVVDFICELASVTEKKVSIEELSQEPSIEEPKK